MVMKAKARAKLSTGSEWFADIPRGSVVVIAGPPGCGKAGLALHFARDFCIANPYDTVLYSGIDNIDHLNYLIERFKLDHNRLILDSASDLSETCKLSDGLGASVLILDTFDHLLSHVPSAMINLLRWVKMSGVTVVIMSGGTNGPRSINPIKPILMHAADIVIAIPDSRRRWAVVQLEIVKQRDRYMLGWVGEPTRDEMLRLVERCDCATIGETMGSGKVIIVGQCVPSFVTQFRSLAFCCRSEVAPLLADRAEEIGRHDLAKQIRIAIGDLGESEYVFDKLYGGGECQ
jgi:hypothetical protein